MPHLIEDGQHNSDVDLGRSFVDRSVFHIHELSFWVPTVPTHLRKPVH